MNWLITLWNYVKRGPACADTDDVVDDFLMSVACDREEIAYQLFNDQVVNMSMANKVCYLTALNMIMVTHGVDTHDLSSVRHFFWATGMNVDRIDEFVGRFNDWTVCKGNRNALQ